MKKYVFAVILFIILLLAMSYYEKQKNKKELDTTCVSVLDSLMLVFNGPDYLISLIESSKQIEAEYVGFATRKSHIYNSYEKLLEVLSDSLWVELSYSDSPVMRYYACRALFSNGSDNFLSVRDRLTKDTTHICFQSFDVFYYYTLGEWIESASK
jgi:hypothetical protein